ncbi:MAG: sigma-70 region 4 domain-containing protein [Dehalococcoidales bacterium]|nr:sigma-70 region 4 domain-containing protein [Dehalococcoidales bacterium]
MRTKDLIVSSDELDLPPEYCHYHDNGCEFANSCLNCPFERCIYDEPGGKQRYLRKLRDREILELYVKGRKIKELALLFGVSQRTVQRALKKVSHE